MITDKKTTLPVTLYDKYMAQNFYYGAGGEVQYIDEFTTQYVRVQFEDGRVKVRHVEELVGDAGEIAAAIRRAKELDKPFEVGAPVSSRPLYRNRAAWNGRIAGPLPLSIQQADGDTWEEVLEKLKAKQR